MRRHLTPENILTLLFAVYTVYHILTYHINHPHAPDI